MIFKKLLVALSLMTALKLSCSVNPDQLVDALLEVPKPGQTIAAIGSSDQQIGNTELSAGRLRKGLGLVESDPFQVEQITTLIEKRHRRDHDDEYRKLSWRRWFFEICKGGLRYIFGKNKNVSSIQELIETENEELSATASSTSKTKTSTLSGAASFAKIDILGAMTFDSKLVYDQGDINSCTANAMGFIIRYWSVKNGASPTNFTSKNLDLINPSRLYHYYNSRLIADKLGKNVGVTAEQAIFSIDKYGTCSEDIKTIDASLVAVKQQVKVGFEYSDTNAMVQPTLENYRFAFDANYSGLSSGGQNPYAFVSQKIRYENLGTAAINFTNALRKGYPIFFGAKLYSAFMNDAISGKFFVPMPASSEVSVGGHAMVIVGWGNYNTAMPSKNYFKVLNSWGPNWGDGGFCYFPQEYIAANTISAYSVYFVK